MEIRTPQDDERLMSLVTLALAQPENQRESYLASACSGNAGLFSQAWNYVQWEARMQGFLLDPLIPPAEDETPFEPGQLLDGRFRIVREVARGGMGIVYEAFDEKLVRCIALKCAKSGFRKRLPPEVRHASEISHPNVCKIFEIHTASTEDGEVDFLTMEFLDGETLATRLSRGPLPEAEARAIGGQICAGLAEAHRNWVVHGDLKGNNVILTHDAGGGVRAVITDFGLASVPVGPAEDIGFGALGPSQAAGTPDYMAPELWKGEKPSAASDVYALGVILYELTTGQRPSPPADRLKQKPPAVRHGRDPIVRRCLDPNPTGRFRDAVEVAAALDTRRSRQRWTRAAAAIVFAAIALAAVSGLVTYWRTEPRKEPVRLAMLPLQLVTDGAGPDVAGMAEQISHKAADELARLKGGTLKRLSVVPRNEVFGRHVDTVEKARSALGATHVVWGTIAWENGKVTVHAFLTDTKTQANSGEWRGGSPLRPCGHGWHGYRGAPSASADGGFGQCLCQTGLPERAGVHSSQFDSRASTAAAPKRRGGRFRFAPHVGGIGRGAVVQEIYHPRSGVAGRGFGISAAGAKPQSRSGSRAPRGRIAAGQCWP